MITDARLRVMNRIAALDSRVRRFERDSRLDAVAPGRVLAPGRVWTGDLESRLERLSAEVRDLVTPFSLGHTLHAEEAPDTLDLGEVYDGLERLEGAVERARRTSARSGDRRSIRLRGGDGDRRGGLLRSRRAPGDRGGAAAPIADINARNRQFWADRDAAHVRTAATDAANRGAYRDLGTGAHMGERIRAINEAARSFWKGRTPKA